MIFFFRFSFFFQSDRPTQYQGTHSTVNEEKKKGDGLLENCDFDLFFKFSDLFNNRLLHGQSLFPLDIIISSLKIAIELDNEY